ncbi:hypothetical protein [Streptomyces sp. BK239]|uniref:hypothetical protein n=1 Tax=Streptomyces sp. BK239 TaxID=2512155 RepID=UPI001A92D7E4|nr:hypothetical protein [Streptomyces sp. BK239]
MRRAPGRLEEAVEGLMRCLGFPPSTAADARTVGAEEPDRDRLADDCVRLAICLRSGVWRFAFPEGDPGGLREDGEPLAPDEDLPAARDELRAWGYAGPHLESLALHVVAGHGVPGLGALTGMLAEGVVKSRQEEVDSLLATVRRGFGRAAPARPDSAVGSPRPDPPRPGKPTMGGPGGLGG